MKKYLLIISISLVAILSSCMAPKDYYQICKVTSNLTSSSDGPYVYRNNDCEIIYDFWSDGGSILFEISNNTDSILFIDLTKSFVIKNGFAYDYFLNRTTASSSSSILSKSSSVSGTALGYWNNYGNKTPGSISATSESSIGTHSSYSVSFVEKPIISIPPHSSKVFKEYSIMSERYQDCDLLETPSRKEISSISFKIENTPMKFINYICYRVGENDNNHFVQNEFYVSEVENNHIDAISHKVDIGCESDLYKKKVLIFNNASPKKFYIEYKPRKQKKNKTKVQKKDKKIR